MGVAERPNGRERARQRDSGRFFDGPWQVQGFGAIMSRANVEGCDAWACLSNSRAWAWAWEACAAAAHKMQAGGQTSNGACVDLVCETGRSVLSWSLGAHLLWWALGIVAIFKLPLGLFEPDPRSLCFALCIRFQALHFRVVIRPNLLVESLPFSLFLPNPNTCFCPDVRFPNSSLKGLLICVPCHFQSLASTHNIIITAITK